MKSAILPRRINRDQIAVQAIGEETLVYDERHHQAWSLNSSAACIWHLCDGQKTIEQIAAAAADELRVPVTADIVLLNLAELRDKDLLEIDTVPPLPEAVTRRQMIGRAGIAAAALFPVVASILAPPAHAQTASMTGMAKPKDHVSKG